MDALLSVVKSINSVLWGYILVFMLVGTGIFFTFKLKFVQVKKFGKGWKQLLGGFSLHGKKAGKEGMSSFQALATAIAAQVGTGNLAGAATAILSGGPGAIFWMWVSAFFGMATIFAEAILAQKYREKGDDGQVVGGPAYYIKNGLHNKYLAGFFSVTIIIALGFIGNMVQANSIADSFKTAFNIPAYVTGIVVAIIAALIFMGGIGRIASFTEKVVPLMAIGYLIVGLIIMITHYYNIPMAFKMIFEGAFNPQAVTGGLIGATVKESVRYGVSRGLFSNEAGMGSTPHAHAVAKVNHPVEQGMVAIVSVFIDTFLVLTMTAMVILTTGSINPEGVKLKGIQLTQYAFTNALGAFGNPFVAICLFFFAFSTIVGWYYFGETNIRFLFGSKGLTPYRILVTAFVFLGSLLSVDLVWELADLFNGIMVIPNVIALIGLSSVVSKTLKEYDDGLVKGLYK